METDNVPITPPLFLWVPDWMIFLSVAEAESWIEPPDVDEFLAYDATGP
jgi:hypothetical protein